MKRYDLVIIGAGSAGLVASLTAARLGARVALVEAERPGGECLFTGCIPSKSLLASAKLAQDMRSAQRVGLEPVKPRVDFARVMARVDSVIEAAGRHDSVEYLTEQGVEVVHGRGGFAGPGRIVADGRELRYRAAMIATGSRPAAPDVPGLEASAYLTNETVFKLRELPKRLAVLGDGPTAVELAQAFARLGSQVDLVALGPCLLPKEEDEAGCLIADTLEAEGVAICAEATVARVERARDGAGTLYLDEAGGERPVSYDRLLVATGQRPATEELGLENVGVELTDEGAVRVDRHLRTTADHIYAAGDVVGQLLLTHVAAYHGLVCVANSLFRARRKVDHSAIPSVTFSDPELARVGLTEVEAREMLGYEPLVFRHQYSESDRALTAGDGRGFAKLVTDRRGRLVGATIVGPAAGESIAEVARLVRDRKGVADLSQMVHAYPTFTEAPARAADEWWRRRYFTPKARRFFKPLLAGLRMVDRPRDS